MYILVDMETLKHPIHCAIPENTITEIAVAQREGATQLAHCGLARSHVVSSPWRPTTSHLMQPHLTSSLSPHYCYTAIFPSAHGPLPCQLALVCPTTRASLVHAVSLTLYEPELLDPPP